MLEKLSGLYNNFLKIPLENFTLYFRNRHPTIEETAEDIKKGFGGDCTSISKFIIPILIKEGFDAKIVHFLNDVKEIDKTIKVIDDIDKMYHSAVLVNLEKIMYILDVGLQYEQPIPLIDGKSYKFPTKSLNIQRKGDLYKISRFDRGSKKIELFFDPFRNWSEEENKKHQSNNFLRYITLKFAKLEGKFKIGLKMKENSVKIVQKDRNSITTLIEGNLKKCSNYLRLNWEIIAKAYKNWSELRIRQGVLDEKNFNPSWTY